MIEYKVVMLGVVARMIDYKVVMLEKVVGMV